MAIFLGTNSIGRIKPVQLDNNTVDVDTKNITERMARAMRENEQYMEVLTNSEQKGFVELIDWMGDDYRILESARVSTGSPPSKGEKKDRGLIRYLYKNRHMSPFEQVTLTFKIKAPLFVIQQLLRHRTFSFNQFSGRYAEMPMEFYVPKDFRSQSETNHQGSGDYLSEEVSQEAGTEMKDFFDESYETYKELVDMGVVREQARSVLPSAMYSVLYVTMNLRNLFHFLTLRMDEHAQWEIREYARVMYILSSNIEGLKWSFEVFDEFRYIDSLYQEAINVSKRNTADLIEALEAYIESKNPDR